MIIVRLLGGLGNQMFQYAAGRRLAVHHNTSLKLDKSWFTDLQNPNAPALRHYELGCFNLKAKFAARSDLARIDIPPHSIKRRLLRGTFGTLTPFYGLEDTKMKFQPQILTAPANSFLEGFWLSEDYFKDIEKIIRADFSFNKSLSGKNLVLANEIRNVNAVSVHVRRGDYVNNKEINKVHGLAGVDYYQTAVKHMTKKLASPHFFIISDDPKWTKDHIKISAPTTYINHNSNGGDDMRLMSLCKHHIIANSTFSWWGAWLNPSKSKTVIAPQKWFNDPDMATKHLIPASWIKL